MKHSLFLVASVLAVAGLAFGAAYFAVLWHSVDHHSKSGPRFSIVALLLARIAAGAVFFWFATRFGALPTLSALLGFLFARFLALRAAQRLPA